MTSIRRRQVTRRAARALPLAAAAGLVLAGCTKPTPLVSVYAGGSTVHSEASVYCFSGQEPGPQGDPGTCRRQQVTPEVLTVRAGQPLVVNVPNDLSKAGWLLTLNGQQFTDRQSDSSVTVTVPNLTQQGGGAAQLGVVKVREVAQGLEAVGQWQFVLDTTGSS